MDGAASDAALDSEIATGVGSAGSSEEGGGELEQHLSEGSDDGWDTDVDIEGGDGVKERECLSAGVTGELA